MGEVEGGRDATEICRKVVIQRLPKCDVSELLIK